MKNNTIAFIINPIAGKRKKVDLPQLITQKCQNYAQSFQIAKSLHANHIPILVKQFLDEGINRIVVAGGDGTINQAATHMIASKAALGIIPLGSGNGLARHLKIPLSPSLALEKLLSCSKLQTIDVGKVNEHYFFSNAGVGYGAAVVNAYDKLSYRGFWAYSYASYQTFLTFSPFVSYSSTGSIAQRKRYILNVANASEYGYGFKIAPQAKINDGFLDLTLTEHSSKIKFLTFPLALKGFALAEKAILRKKITNMTFSFNERLPLQVDGEYKGKVKQVVFEIKPQLLNLLT